MLRTTTLLAVVAGSIGMATSVQSQQTSPIAAGGWIIGGSAGVSRSHDDLSDLSTTSTFLSPSLLYFVRERLAVGGTVFAAYSSNSQGHSRSAGIGPSARYYFGDPAGRVFPFVSGSVTPQWQTIHTTTTVGNQSFTTDGTFRTTSYDGSLGLTDIIATNVGLTAEAYYTRSVSQAAETRPRRTVYATGLRFGFTVFGR